MPRKIIICIDCGGTRTQEAHGLCKTCYLRRRRIKEPGFRERENLYSARYYSNHSEQRKAKRSEYYAEHTQACRAATNHWSGTHPGQVKILALKWRATHSETVRMAKQVRRARQRAVETTLTTEQWQVIKHSYKERCAYCGNKPAKLTQDHVLPIFRGGGYTAANIVPACQSCNSKKHTGLPPKPVQTLLL